MARIRTVKPEVFKHEDLFDLEKQTGLPIRFAWIGLFTVCDREGRFKWMPRRLGAELLPYDNVDFEAVLDTLLEANLIHKYEFNGELFGCIPTFLKHQVINVREAQSVIPAPSEGVMLPAKRTRHIPQDMCMHVRARDKHRCRMCGSVQELQFDHIIPFSKGGDHSLENLQLLCRRCNIRKSDRCLEAIEAPFEVSTVHAHALHMSNPVHASGEGKGKEGKGKEDKYMWETNQTMTMETIPNAGSLKSKRKRRVGIRVDYPHEFNELWIAYGRRGDKSEAYEAYERLKLLPGEVTALKTAIQKYTEGSSLKYRKHFCNFLQTDWREVESISDVPSTSSTRQNKSNRSDDIKAHNDAVFAKAFNKGGLV